MEQFIILIIIAVISFVNWLMQRSAELREKKKLERKAEGLDDTSPYRGEREQQPLPRPARPSVDPEAEMRKLMEALGLPVDDAPPTVVVERPAPPPLPEAEPLVVPLAPRPIPRPEPAARTAPATVLSRAPGRLAAALGNPASLRQAIVLRSVLGPAKGLAQPSSGRFPLD